MRQSNEATLSILCTVYVINKCVCWSDSCEICIMDAFQVIEAECCIYDPVKQAIVISDKGLLPVWHQAIIWTNTDL